jgi:hypothetical protein
MHHDEGGKDASRARLKEEKERLEEADEKRNKERI